MITEFKRRMKRLENAYGCGVITEEEAHKEMESIIAELKKMQMEGAFG